MALLLESIVVFSHCEYIVPEVFVGESVLNGSYDLSYYGYEQIGHRLNQINEDPQIYVTNLNKKIHIKIINKDIRGNYLCKRKIEAHCCIKL